MDDQLSLHLFSNLPRGPYLDLTLSISYINALPVIDAPFIAAPLIGAIFIGNFSPPPARRNGTQARKSLLLQTDLRSVGFQSRWMSNPASGIVSGTEEMQRSSSSCSEVCFAPLVRSPVVPRDS